MSRLVKLVGSGIGLAREASAAQRSSPSSGPNGNSSASRAPSPYAEQSTNQLGVRHDHIESSNEGLAGDDEIYWDLDDAADDKTAPPEYSQLPINVDQNVQLFAAQHPVRSDARRTGRLTCPVILPQRRPGTKDRGFVRAYAPMLADCGIDQSTFMDFLESFNQASKASPIFNVLHVGAVGLHAIPLPAAIAIAASVQMSIGVASELQGRHRTNTFLDQINDKLFKPHGLLCLIMTYEPNRSAGDMLSGSVDISAAVLKSAVSRDFSMGGQLRNLQGSSGTTRGELQMPEAAPLIFPALEDRAAVTSPDAQKQSALKKGQKFLADYYDKRANATFAAENPNSTLSSNEPIEFASRYSDPNHPVVNGSILSLITGGNIDPKSHRESRRSQRGPSRRERHGHAPGDQNDERRQRPLRRFLHHDTLYLMVVNMPSQAEIDSYKCLAVQSRMT